MMAKVEGVKSKLVGEQFRERLGALSRHPNQEGFLLIRPDRMSNVRTKWPVEVRMGRKVGKT